MSCSVRPAWPPTASRSPPRRRDPDDSNDIASASVVVTEPPSFEEFIVRGYFREVLGIEATDEQVERWTEELYEYGYTDGFALELLKTYTFRSRFVDETYEKLLGRSADAAGLAVFTRALSQGATYEQVRATLAGSSEYYRKAGGTRGAFIGKLVSDMTGKAPSPTLRASLALDIASGTSRTDVATRIVTSHLGRGAWVRQQYRRYYQREAFDYEEAGAVSWLFSGQRPARVLVQDHRHLRVRRALLPRVLLLRGHGGSASVVATGLRRPRHRGRRPQLQPWGAECPPCPR